MLLLTCLEAESPRLRCWQVWFLLRLFMQTCRWPSSLCVFPLCLCIQGVSLCVKIPSYKDTSQIRLGCHFKGPTSKYSRVLRCWRLGLQHMKFRGETIQPITWPKCLELWVFSVVCVPSSSYQKLWILSWKF